MKDTEQDSLSASDINKSYMSTAKPRFPHFQLLSDDLQIMILSFVADAPFQSGDLKKKDSSLTHVLPFVSKHISELLEGTSLFWKQSLICNVKSDSKILWEEGILRLLKDCLYRLQPTQGVGADDQLLIKNVIRDNKNERAGSRDDLNCVKEQTLQDVINSNKEEEDYEKKLVDQVCKIVAVAFAGPNPPCDELLALNSKAPPAQLAYHYVTTKYLRFRSPVFHMPGDVRLGQEFSLHFFEPRYCLLIAEVMRNQPDSAKRGGSVELDPETHSAPSFIYAHERHFTKNAPAVIVEVKHCLIYPNGRADVSLVPTAHVSMQKAWVRPNTGSLNMAEVLRMGAQDSQLMEQKLTRRYYNYGNHGSNFLMEGGAEAMERQNQAVGNDAALEDNRLRGSIASVIAHMMAAHDNETFDNITDDQDD